MIEKWMKYGLLLSIAFTVQSVSAEENPENGADVAAKLPEILVEDDKETVKEVGYSTKVSASTRTDIPLLESSQSITVINETLMKDQMARKLDDALSNVAGVIP